MERRATFIGFEIRPYLTDIINEVYIYMYMIMLYIYKRIIEYNIVVFKAIYTVHGMPCDRQVRLDPTHSACRASAGLKTAGLDLREHERPPRWPRGRNSTVLEAFPAFLGCCPHFLGGFPRLLGASLHDVRRCSRETRGLQPSFAPRGLDGG